MKVGDKVVLTKFGKSCFGRTSEKWGVGTVVGLVGGVRVKWKGGPLSIMTMFPNEIEPLVAEEQQTEEVIKGSASAYYDLPFKSWVTTNDMIEYLAETRWGKFSPGLKDVFKALVRWGEKDGTDNEYDANKIIYYGCRVLRQLNGNEAVRKTLQGLLDHPQFKD